MMKCWYRQITVLQVDPNSGTMNHIRENYKNMVSQREQNKWYIDRNVINKYKISDNEPYREEIDKEIENLRTRSSPGPTGVTNKKYRECRDECYRMKNYHRNYIMENENNEIREDYRQMRKEISNIENNLSNHTFLSDLQVIERNL